MTAAAEALGRRARVRLQRYGLLAEEVVSLRVLVASCDQREACGSSISRSSMLARVRAALLDGLHHQDAQVGDHTGASSSSDERQVTVLEAPKLAVASSGSGAEDKAEEELQAQAGCMEEVHLLVEVLALASAHGTETSDDRA